MIRRLFKSIFDFLRNPARSFKERVYVLLTMIIDFVGILALIGDIIVGENIVEIIVLIVTVLSVPVLTIVSVRKNWIMLSFRLIVLYVITILLPVLFFFGGGMMGGGYVWIIFAYVYTGLILSGKWKPAVLIILTMETAGFFAIGYYYPDTVTKHTVEVAVVDVALSVVQVGMIGCFLVWFEEWLFREENHRAMDEMKKTEDLNRSQSRFFSSMSHEIRTPINSILGLNEIILRQEDASDEIIRDASNIQGAGKMLLALINDILDMSKIEAGKMDIVPINYNLGSMISEIVNMMWLRAEQKGLELKIEIDPSIPAELYGDEVRIKQILVNLLNNAVKYTNDGSVTLRIEKEEVRGEDVLLLFSVIDTGMGIKQDVIPYLFDAFQRVDEEKNAKIEGTGLGLTIVKQLVDLMEGKVTVNSVYTEGTTFVVALWQKVTRREAIGEVSIEDYGKKLTKGRYVPGFTAPDARILIVDDNEMNLEVEKKLLDGTRMTIDTAMSGEEALFMASKERYDVILMDHLMPEMDGIQCMQTIRKQVGGLNNHTPVIILTANADSENRELYNRNGFDGYLVKPVSGTQLENIMVDHLPEAKVELSEGSDINRTKMSTSGGYSKKIPVVIATSSMCDLPAQVLRAHQIDIIPFSVISGDKTYYDLMEASVDEVMRYVADGMPFDSNPPSVSDFEQFFGKEVKKAHQVIYIAVSNSISHEVDNAKEAAKAFGNVWVVDSKQNSTAMGFMVLLAQRMVMQGRNFEKIIEELENLKSYVHCSFITGDAELVLRRGGYSKALQGFAATFNIKPVIHIKKGVITPARACAGEYLDCYYKYLDFALPRNCNPDLEVLVVDYVSLTEDEKEAIIKYIRKKYPFENIFFQKVSSVMALNCGRGAMGVAYLKKYDQPYNILQMTSSILTPDEDGETSPSEYEQETQSYGVSGSDVGTTVIEPAQDGEEKWYEKIPGIDPVKALENSGSEDAFKSVLKIFYNSVDDRSGEIEEYYKNEDWENYTVKVHALKSSAKLVGAMELSEKALALENAGKARNLDYIREHTDSLLSDFRNYKTLFAPIFEEEQKEDSTANEFVKSLYEAITEATENQDDMELEEVLNEAMEFDLSQKDFENLDKIRDAFEAKDYGLIKQLADI